MKAFQSFFQLVLAIILTGMQTTTLASTPDPAPVQAMSVPPSIVNLETTKVQAGSSKAFTVYECPEHPEVTKDLVERAETMRTRISVYVEHHNIFRHLASDPIRKECVKAVAEFLSLGEDVPRMEELYRQELKTIVQSKFYDTLFSGELYIYDQKACAKKLHAGEKIPYVILFGSIAAVMNDWSPNLPGDDLSLHMPVVLMLESNFTDFGREIQARYLDSRELAMKLYIKKANAQLAYRFTVEWTRTVLAEKYPAVPLWFREGIANYMGMTTSIMWFGQNDGIEAMSIYLNVYPAANVDRKALNVETWNPTDCDRLTYKSHVISIFQAIHTISGYYGKNLTYVPRLMKKLKDHKEVTLDTICADTRALDKALDFKALLPPNPRPKNMVSK